MGLNGWSPQSMDPSYSWYLHQNQNRIQNYYRYSSKMTGLITMKFCTYQDSTAILVCTKFHCEQTDMRRYERTSFNWIWNLVQFSLVGWVSVRAKLPKLPTEEKKTLMRNPKCLSEQLECIESNFILSLHTKLQRLWEIIFLLMAVLDAVKMTIFNSPSDNGMDTLMTFPFQSIWWLYQRCNATMYWKALIVEIVISQSQFKILQWVLYALS